VLVGQLERESRDKACDLAMATSTSCGQEGKNGENDDCTGCDWKDMAALQ